MRYGEAIPADFDIPRAARFWMNKDLTQRNPFQLVRVRKGDRVMDCGSCIGTFAAAALAAGASHVRCYEPMPKNAAVLRSNMTRYGERATVIQAALIDSKATGIEMEVSGFSGAHSIVRRKPAARTEFVRAVCFRDELKKFKPQVIKMDVEGAEYVLLPSLRRKDLAGVSCVSLEFHKTEDRKARVDGIVAYLVAEGFVIASDKLRAFVALRPER